MKEYIVIYRNNTSREVAVTGKAELIKEYFGNSEEQFKKEVSLLRWTELSMECMLDVNTGKISSEIFSADVNPYGWRDGERG